MTNIWGGGSGLLVQVVNAEVSERSLLERCFNDVFEYTGICLPLQNHKPLRRFCHGSPRCILCT